MINNMKITKKLINQLTLKTNNELEKHVLNDMYDEEYPKEYLEQVLQHGCVSGVVGGLMYYADTKAFYIKYMEEIEELLQEVKDNMGYNVLENAKYPLYNWLAWFGYEETIRKIANDLNLDL